MWTAIIEFIISPMVVAFMGFVVWKLQQQTKQTSANNRGTMILLRDKIFDDHEKYVVERRPMPSYAYQNFLETYDAYRALGGNGVVVKMMNEMEELHISGDEA